MGSSRSETNLIEMQCRRRNKESCTQEGDWLIDLKRLIGVFVDMTGRNSMKAGRMGIGKEVHWIDWMDRIERENRQGR